MLSSLRYQITYISHFTGTHKFDRGLSRLLHTELHWLDIPERVTYKLGIIMFGCQHGRAPQYLIECCLPVSDVDVASRQPLRSASRRLLVVPRHRLSTYGRRAFAVAGPTLGQSPVSRCYNRKLQALVENVFVFSVPVQLAHEMCHDDALYKFTFYLLYLLTY